MSSFDTEDRLMQSVNRVDPIQFEVIRNALVEATEELAIALRRSAYSTNIKPEHATSFTILADRDRWGPWGLFGGQPGLKASYLLNPETDAIELGSKTTVQLKAGDVVSYRTCGGGGYGSPEDRDPQAVLSDVQEQNISLERARKVYHVAIDPDSCQVDAAQTNRLREANIKMPTG